MLMYSPVLLLILSSCLPIHKLTPEQGPKNHAGTTEIRRTWDGAKQKAESISTSSAVQPNYLPLDGLTVYKGGDKRTLEGCFMLGDQFQRVWPDNKPPSFYYIANKNFDWNANWAPVDSVKLVTYDKEQTVSYRVTLPADVTSGWLMVLLHGEGEHSNEQWGFFATYFPGGDFRDESSPGVILPISLQPALIASRKSLAVADYFLEWKGVRGTVEPQDFTAYESNDNTPSTNWTGLNMLDKGSSNNGVKKRFTFDFDPEPTKTYFCVYTTEVGAWIDHRKWSVAAGFVRVTGAP